MGRVNVKEFDDALTVVLKNTRRGMVETIRDEARLLFSRIIYWKGGAIATPPQTKDQGEKAVERDIYQAVFPLRAESFKSARMRKSVRKYISEGNHVALQKMAERGALGKRLKKAFIAEFSPAMHKSQRNARGQVTANRKRNRYKYATDDVQELKAYIEKKQAMVGQGKGGWVAALERLGGKAANWITRHRSAGTFEDRLHLGNPKISFTGINKSKWAEGGDEDRIIEMAKQGRAEAMLRNLERTIEQEWNKA